MNGDGFQRITRSGKAKKASKLRSGGGIKAIITIGDLQSVVTAAKKWQAKCVEDGVDASKLLHHIANAEAVLLKYRARNKLAYEWRERMRRYEEEDEVFEREDAVAETEAAAPTELRREPSALTSGAWNALDALGKGKEEARRPTRW